MSYNQATLVGRLGADPETRKTSAGDPVVSLRLATSESWKDKASGERKERTEWHSVVIFNEALGRIVAEHCAKGSQILVEGQIQTRKWTDRDGAERYTTEIVLGRFDGAIKLLARAPDRSAPDRESYGSTRTREGSVGSGGGAGARGPDKASGANYDLGDDIPF